MASLFTSMFNGLSGLRANSVDLSVIGDNIANSNTIGFKGSRVAFEDALGETLIGSGANGGQVGLGVNVQAVQRILTQGSLANTGVATDLAIQGEGFFVLNGPDGQTFTRNGQFSVDQDGRLVTLSGDRVQGFQADASGQINSGFGDIVVSNISAPPTPTSEVTLGGNLDATATVFDPAALPPAPAFDPANPEATSNFQTSTTIFDSLGNAIDVQLFYRKVGATPPTWEVHALTDGANVTGGTPGTPFELTADNTVVPPVQTPIQMTFNTDGTLQSVTGNQLTINPVGATQGQDIDFNLGDPTATGGTGLGGLTQFASASAVSFVSQDGSAAGDLANVRIEPDGTILGVFTNGVSQALGQVAIATFNAADQLERQGGNKFAVTGTSGQPNIGIASTGGRGSIVGGALEQSNVDVGDELVRMIIAQRSFQANSKIVSTADNLLGELINLKR
jgi:flagellar hook protein FlgE